MIDDREPIDLLWEWIDDGVIFSNHERIYDLFTFFLGIASCEVLYETKREDVSCSSVAVSESEWGMVARTQPGPCLIPIRWPVIITWWTKPPLSHSHFYFSTLPTATPRAPSSGVINDTLLPDRFKSAPAQFGPWWGWRFAGYLGSYLRCGALQFQYVRWCGMSSQHPAWNCGVQKTQMSNFLVWNYPTCQTENLPEFWLALWSHYFHGYLAYLCAARRSEFDTARGEYKYLNFDPSTQDPRTERIKYYTPLSNFVTNILQWLPLQLPQKQMQLPWTRMKEVWPTAQEKYTKNLLYRLVPLTGLHRLKWRLLSAASIPHFSYPM